MLTSPMENETDILERLMNDVDFRERKKGRVFGRGRIGDLFGNQGQGIAGAPNAAHSSLEGP
jgi:hypothetical protein